MIDAHKEVYDAALRWRTARRAISAHHASEGYAALQDKTTAFHHAEKELGRLCDEALREGDAAESGGGGS